MLKIKIKTLLKEKINFKKIRFYLIRIPFSFLLILVAFITIHSFASCVASNDLDSFRKAVETKKNYIPGGNVVIGLKGSLAINQQDKSPIKEVDASGCIKYRVGINDGKTSFKIGDESITPIESNYRRYYWTDQVTKDFVLQEVKYSELSEYDFENDDYNAILPQSLYEMYGKSNKIQIYSELLDKELSFNVVGVFNDPTSLSYQYNLFKIYKLPVFLNYSGFNAVFGDKLDFFENAQVDIEFNGGAKFSPGLSKVFGDRNWRDQVIKYEPYNDVYELMKEYSLDRRLGEHLILGFVCLASLGATITIMFIFQKEFTFSLITTINPYILVILWSIAGLATFGFSKLMKSTLLFYEPAFFLTLSIILFVLAISVILYFCFRAEEKQIDGNVI